MKLISQINENEKLKALFRADFDVPISESGKILEDFRISKQREAVEGLLNGGVAVFMIAHIAEIDSFRPIIDQLENIFSRKIYFVEDLNVTDWKVEHGNLYLLDNVRKWPGEKDNDSGFAKKIAEPFDIYINNAFAVSHRKHASVSAITEFLPSYCGPLIELETKNLERAVSSPSDGKIFIMGGAKASTKIPVVKNFLNKVESILIGGVIANDILKKRGVDINGSKFDEDFESLLAGLDLSSPRLVMPLDYNVSNGNYLDIGPKSVENFRGIVMKSKMIIWNGPMGLFEKTEFAKGTDGIAEAVINSKAFKIIGGGDTIAAVNNKYGLDKFDFVSTGGGAMLAFLAEERLPGLEALGYYAK